MYKQLALWFFHVNSKSFTFQVVLDQDIKCGVAVSICSPLHFSEIWWCYMDHSNETLSVQLLNNITIYFLRFYQKKFEIL